VRVQVGSRSLKAFSPSSSVSSSSSSRPFSLSSLCFRAMRRFAAHDGDDELIVYSSVCRERGVVAVALVLTIDRELGRGRAGVVAIEEQDQRSISGVCRD